MLLLSSDPPDPRALGGVALHAAALAQGAATRLDVFTAYPRGGALHVEAWRPRRLVAAIPLGAHGDEALFRALCAAMAGTGAGVLHVHSPQLGPHALVRAAAHSGARLVVTLHDHALACENYTLLEGGERHCDVPSDLSRCDTCLAATAGRPPGAVLRHRASMQALVRETFAFVAPSRSVVDLCARVHPEMRARVRAVPWGVPRAPERPARTPAAASGPLRIAFVGLLSREKGRERLPALLSACRHLNVEWHLFGATQGAPLDDVVRSAPRVVIHGAYRRHDLARRLATTGCQVGFLPSVAAESFSLALSDVLAAGLPVLVSDLGALAERVTADALGWTFDPWLPASLASVVSTLEGDRTLVDEAAARVRSRAVRTDADMAIDHVRLWRDVAPQSGVAKDPAALNLFREGERRAKSPVLSVLLPLVARIRGSLFYQDLRLRQLVSERRRKAIEHALSTLFSRARR